METSSQSDHNGLPLLDIAAVIRTLWARKWVIVASFITVLFIAFAYLAVTKPIYTAHGVILLDPRETNATATSNVLGGIGSDSAAIASQVTVISSPELLRGVFNDEKIAEDPEFAVGGGMLSSAISLVRGPSAPNTNASFEAFRSRVAVEREGLTYVINVSFTSGDPEKAARIVNAVIQRYISGQVAEKSDASVEVTDLLNSRIGGLREAVSDAESAVEAFKTEHNIFDVGAGKTLLDSQIEQLNAQLLAAQETAREAANRSDQAEAIGTSPEGLTRLTDFLSSTSAEQLRNSYNQRLADIASARAKFGSRHPTLISLEAEVARLQGLMGSEAERIIAELGANKDLASDNVVRINAELTRLRTEASQSSQLNVQLRQLERNAEASRQVLEQFLSRSEETSQMGQLQRPDAHVVSAATPPVQATWPKTPLILAVAGVFGLLLGSAIAMLLGKPEVNYMPVILGTPKQDGERSVAIVPPPPSAPVLQEARSAVRIVDHGVVTTRYSVASASPDLNEDGLEELRLEAAKFPRSPFAMQVRSLMYRLLGGFVEDQGPLVLLMTSVDNAFEKDRLAFALALQMQKQGMVPLIVDLAPLQPAEDRATASGDGTAPTWQSLIDGRTGIAVLNAKTSATSVSMIKDAVVIEHAISSYGETVDALIIIGRSLTDPSYSVAIRHWADQQIVVLDESEALVKAEAAIARRTIGPEDISGVVVISHGDEPVTPTVRSKEVAAAAAEIRINRYVGLN
jgi:succinoglycan biosynthesis transport protein ExoP